MCDSNMDDELNVSFCELREYPNHCRVSDFHTDYKCDCEQNPNCIFRKYKRQLEHNRKLRIDNNEYLKLLGVSSKEEYDKMASYIRKLQDTITTYQLKDYSNNQVLFNILNCLENANKTGKITDTIFMDKFTTLFDYISLQLPDEYKPENIS